MPFLCRLWISPSDIQYFPEPIPSDCGPNIFHKHSKSGHRHCSNAVRLKKESTCCDSVLSTMFVFVLSCLCDHVAEKLEPKAGTKVSTLASNQGRPFIEQGPVISLVSPSFCIFPQPSLLGITDADI